MTRPPAHQVLAVDRAISGRVNTGTAAIVVRVQDVEDQPPQFIQAPPVTRIPEDIPVNSGVLEGEFPGHLVLLWVCGEIGGRGGGIVCSEFGEMRVLMGGLASTPVGAVRRRRVT